MEVAFYASSLIAIGSTCMVITRTNAVHALLYLIISLMSVAIVMFTLGAPFVAALEVIVYAGAIMVLFVFVVMMLNVGQQSVGQERSWLSPGAWVGPSIVAAILIVEMAYALLSGATNLPSPTTDVIPPKEVGIALFGPYVIAVELASMLLLTGIVGAYHLGRRGHEPIQRPGQLPQMAAGNGQGREEEVKAGVGPTSGQRVREKV